MKRLILAIATLTLLPQFVGCDSGAPNPGGDMTQGSTEAQEYEKRRAEERAKGTRPPVGTGTAPR